MNSGTLEMFRNKGNSDSTQYKMAKLGLTIFCIIGATPALYYVFFSEATYPNYVNALLIASSIFLYLNAIAFQYHDNFQLTALLCGLGLTPPMLAVVASGGYDNTGLFWVFPYVLAVFMFLGYSKGLIINLIAYSGIAILLLVPDVIDANYQQSNISRFLTAYLVSIFLCFSAEYFKLRSITQLTGLNKDKHKQANTDPLTSLANRRYVDSEFLRECSATPELFFPLALVLIDIDHFKQVNDVYGHNAGDQVLKHAANIFTQNVRESDVVCRVGGEEFLLLIPKANLSASLSIAENIRRSIEQDNCIYQSKTIAITVSAGVSLINAVSEFEQVFDYTDKLLYQAKRKGRNRIEDKLSEN